jgi:flagellar motility protein MotE (MotC chaperone)
MDQAVDELHKERGNLLAREKHVEELEARVLAERAGLDEATRAIQKLQADLERDIVRVKDDEAPNLKKLAKMYTSMEPAGAAAILRELEDSVLVKILTFMKEAETAPILEALARRGEADTKRAARVSEFLRLASVARAPTKKP